VKSSLGGEVNTNTGRQTRSGAQVLSAIRTGLLPEVCLICGKKERRTNSTREKLSLIMTIPFQNLILEDAKELEDAQMFRQVNGIDLVAKEGRYHNTCRKEYAYKAQAKRKVREVNENCERQKNVNIRKEAFDSTTAFIQSHVIDKEQVNFL
jgi:hypothetical protein